MSVTLFAGEGEHDHHDHGSADLGNLGKVSFETSCQRTVRDDFNRAVALMHSFWYAEAESAFGRIAEADPKCAMAHWGVAMSNYHPLWAPPTPDEFRKGKEAAEKASVVAATTDRERDYIAAINAFYADAADHRARAVAYAQAMEKLAAKYPKDREATIFYALALNGTAVATDKTYGPQKKAAELLNRVLPAEPEHPGIAHYIIHSYDNPELASLALPAARAYAKIAPGSPHALHMPSHIFTRLGLWDESITSNLASAAKARQYMAQARPGSSSFDELHAVDYLVYAYLQEAKDDEAAKLLEKIRALDASKLDLPNFAAAYALSAVPARYAVERRRWDDAAHLEVQPAAFPWKNFEYAEANTHFARAIGGARSGDLNTAKKAVDRLGEIRRHLVEQKNAFWADQVEIQRLSAQAWLARAAGLDAEGLRLMREAADLESRTDKHPVTPGAIIPARELLAEMLLESGNAAEAAKEAAQALTVAPNRFNGLWLAAQAGEMANDRATAEARYRSLMTLAGSGTRPELEKARTYLAAHPSSE